MALSLFISACNPFAWQEAGDIISEEGQLIDKESQKFEPRPQVQPLKKAKVSCAEGEQSVPIYCVIWEF